MTHRELKFTSLNDVLAELQFLGDSDRATTGNWSYYQILKHLANSIEASLVKEGEAPKSTEVEKRVTDVLFRRLEKSGKMRAGLNNPYETSDRVDGNVGAEYNRLIDVIRRFQQHSGELNPESTMGTLDYRQYEYLHALHCALHLGFVGA